MPLTYLRMARQNVSSAGFPLPFCRSFLEPAVDWDKAMLRGHCQA